MHDDSVDTDSSAARGFGVSSALDVRGPSSTESTRRAGRLFNEAYAAVEDSLGHLAVLRLLMALTCLVMGGACRDTERYSLWPPAQSVGDKVAYVALSSSLCSMASARFTSEQTETGIIEVLAVDDGATRVQHRVTSQTDESVAADGTRASEAGVLIGRDLLIERTGPRQWKRSLEGTPPADDAEKETVADRSGPYVGEPEDYPKKPVALHETWPVSVKDDDSNVTATCSITMIDTIETLKYAVVDCSYAGSIGGKTLSSMTTREWISLAQRQSLKNEIEAHFEIPGDGKTVSCSTISLFANSSL